MVFKYAFDDYDYDYEVEDSTVAENLDEYFGIRALAEKYRDKIYDTLTQEEVDSLSEYFGINVDKDNIVDLVAGDSDYSWFIDDIISNYQDIYDSEFDELKDIFEDEARMQFEDEDFIDQAEAEKEWNSDYYRSRL